MPKRKKAMHELAGGGDDGTTGLLENGRTEKDDPRIKAYKTVDEASNTIGLTKALTTNEQVQSIAKNLQRDLYRLSAELSTNLEHQNRFRSTSTDDVADLDRLMADLEAEMPMPTNFVLPGTTPASNALD